MTTNKMRELLVLISAIFLGFNLNAQIVDRAPTGKENILPVEGGGIVMEIDRLIPLHDLIIKLNDDWQFIETGKGYWIGYTNDMFSIANRGNQAISPLIDFFKNTANEKGKIGAICTLHLIGIERRIVGRFYEEFKNKRARLALLELMEDKDYVYDIVKLLIRDPWQSDVPYLLEKIKNTDDNVSWPIVNSLERYKIDKLPINNLLSEELKNLKIKLSVENENFLEPNFDFDSQIKQALKGFSDQFPNAIRVEPSLHDMKLTRGYRTKLPSSVPMDVFLGALGIEPASSFSYTRIGCKIQYYLEGEKLNFCSIKTARNRVIIWWDRLSEEEKERYESAVN